MRAWSKVSLLVALSVLAGLIPRAQDLGTDLGMRIPRASKLFIVPMDGFDSYLAAAIQKERVPILIVDDRDQANFVLKGTYGTRDPKPGTMFGNAKLIFDASIRIINVKTGVVVYTRASQDDNRSLRSACEEIAKDLRKKMSKDEKVMRKE